MGNRINDKHRDISSPKSDAKEKNKSEEKKAAGDRNKNNFLETDGGKGLRKMIK